MKIAWFTPFHPHSSIGHYSEEIAAGLAETDEVVVYASDAPRSARAGAARVVALRDGGGDALLRELGRFDAVVYNMGNHLANHKTIYEVLLRHPGVVVLHDLVLRDFCRDYLLEEKRAPYVLARLMAGEGGPDAEAAARAFLAGRHVESLADPARLRFPMFRAALPRCLGVIVHSEYSRARVAAAVSAPVARLDFPPHGPCAAMAREPVPDRPRASAKVHLLTFGVLNSNKLIHHVIKSIGRSAALRAGVVYTIVGEEGEAGYARRLHEVIERLGLSAVVRLAGRLSDDELRTRLIKADVVINLRNPHLGESSGSLLNALLAGAAIVVWNHGCYAEFPDDVVCKIDSEAALTGALKRLCRDPDLRAGFGAAARRHALARFNTAIYCRDFRAFVAEVLSRKPILDLTDALSDLLAEFGAHPPSGLVERLASEIAVLARPAAA